MPNLSVNLSGYGNITGESIVVTGDVTAGDDVIATDAVTAGGIISTTAAGTAADPAISCGSSGGGIYQIAANFLGISNGTSVYIGVTTNDIQLINGNTSIHAGQVSTGILSPAQITSNQTDYNPFSTNQHLYYNVRLTSDAARTINSLVNAVSGKEFVLWNINTNPAFTITLLHDDGATGTAAQRILCPANTSLVIPANGSAVVWYDTTSVRWRAARRY